MSELTIWRIPYSTNVERVALALGHHRLTATWIDVDPADRSAVVQVSGQDLVPVLRAGDDEVIADSPAILAWIDAHGHGPPLYPADPARRTETLIAIEWFNRVWKGPPNAITAQLESDAPDEVAIAGDSAWMRGSLAWFERLLTGRRFLLSDTVGALDICAYPFLKYGTATVSEDDPDRFHVVLAEHLGLGGDFPLLRAWIDRMADLPQA